MNSELKKGKEWTMDIGKANLYAITLIIPIGILFFLPFMIFWGASPIGSSFRNLNFYVWFVIFAGIIAHELLHGLTWALFASEKFKSIKFGVNWQYITPYCHCKEPLKVKHYLAGAAMPLIVLGILPSIYAIVSGKADFLIFGTFFSWAAGGDIIAMFAMRKLNKNTLVSDHPDKLGFIIEEEV